MKIKVSETSKIQLDWLVAKCEGFNAEALIQLAKKVPGKDYGCFLTKYSTNWSQGGPIIEREKLSVCPGSDAPWMACDKDALNRQAGPTPLRVAMECFVASKLGDAVEVPDELGEQP